MPSRASKDKKKRHGDPILSAKSLMENVTGEKWETRVKNPAAGGTLEAGSVQGRVSQGSKPDCKAAEQDRQKSGPKEMGESSIGVNKHRSAKLHHYP